VSYSSFVKKTFIIHWKSKVNGRAGRGTKLFEQLEAERLVSELNRDYPEIEHEAIEAPSSCESEPSAQEAVEYVGAE